MENFMIENLSFSYSNNEEKAIKNVSLKIEQGEFIVICGKSGSGKSTLLRMLKPELTPNGKTSGIIKLFNKEKNDFTQRESAECIGFLLQNTEYQAITHTVRSELAFGLENLEYDSKTIRLRIAELSAYFSLERIIDKKISELSGGQKQIVCLASIVAMHPKAIILDEPTSQLDPVSFVSFLEILQKLCRENGITIILTEHRLENVVGIADRVIIMENGEIISDSSPQNISKKLLNENEFAGCSMPVPMRLFAELDIDEKFPLNVVQAYKKLNELLKGKVKYTNPQREEKALSKIYAVEMKNVWYAYNSSGYVLKNMNLKIKSGSFTALMGSNGAGKTTVLSLMSGLLECKSGKIKLFCKDIKKYKNQEIHNGMIAVLPQKCECLFAGNTIREDLECVLKFSECKKSDVAKKIDEVAKFTQIQHLLDRHPYDVSGGELQKSALAMILLKQPQIIFLDEPTKGMDNLFKKQFAEKMHNLCSSGITVVMVSHDTEFCAEYCDECAMIFDGMCVSQENRYDFFANNYFYTTSANKIARDVFPSAITQGQVLQLCKINLQN